MNGQGEPKQVRGKAREWFEGLPEVPRDAAVAMLKDGDTVTMAVGTPRLERITRDQAIAMIEGGARQAPAGQSRLFLGHNLVVIDPEYGVPVQLQTKSIADLLAMPAPEGMEDIDFDPPRLGDGSIRPADLE